MSKLKMRSAALAATVCLVAIAPGTWGQDGDAAQPCTSPENSQFDFWVGSWQDAFLGIYTRTTD